MTAMCTATPYPILKIGNGITSAASKISKNFNDRESAIDGDLNPIFGKIYELDAIMPDDWKLTVSLMDKRQSKILD